jgi:hypothetical protein
MVMFADSVTDVDGLLDADDDCVGVLVGYSVSLLRSIVVEIVPVVVTLADRLCSLRSFDRLGDGVTVGMDVFVREGVYSSVSVAVWVHVTELVAHEVTVPVLVIIDGLRVRAGEGDLVGVVVVVTLSSVVTDSVVVMDMLRVLVFVNRSVRVAIDGDLPSDSDFVSVSSFEMELLRVTVRCVGVKYWVMDTVTFAVGVMLRDGETVRWFVALIVL